MAGQNQILDLTNYAIEDGTSCWAYGDATGGESHESGDDFTFSKNAATATYQCNGNVDDLSFSLS